MVCRSGATGVLRVEVRGHRRVDGQGICSELKHPAGGPVDADGVHRDLLALWQSGVFSDLRVVERGVPGGVVLSYVVSERPLVSRVTYSEIPVLSSVELNLLTSSLRIGSVVKRAALARISGLVADELFERGYVHALVKSEVHPDGADLVRVHFAITPGPQLLIGALRFVGNRQVSEAELRAVVARTMPSLRPGAVYRAADVDRALQFLLAYYYDHGMVNARMEAPSAPESEHDHTVTVELKVDEGAIYKVGTIRFAGMRPTAGAEARYAAASGITTGTVFSRSEIAASRGRIEAVHRELGGTGSPNPETKVHDQVVDILWRLDP